MDDGLRVEIADCFFGRAHVGAHDRDQILVDLAADEELHDRDAQALFEDLARLGGEDTAADVGRVAGVGEVGDHATVDEDRREDGHIVDLAAVCQGSLVSSTSPGSSVSGG